MIRIIEITTTMLIIMLGGKINDFYKSDLIELHLSNGNVQYVEINKKNNYSCPKTCKANHFHHTLILENVLNKMNYNITYNNKESDKISLNDIEVLKVFEIIEQKKNKKNKISKVKRNRLNIQNFINKYD